MSSPRPLNQGEHGPAQRPGAAPAPAQQDLLAAALAAPAAAATWRAAHWTLLVQQSRRAGLLGRLADQLGAAQVHAHLLPAGVSAHFEAAQRVCRAQHAEIQREVAFIGRALGGLGAPVVLLKGAAYVIAGLPAASGRVFGDVDILVPRDALPRAESLLMQAGWLTTHQSAYDQRYYRQWMHELPPMQHLHRGTVLDVHHGILALTARLRPDPRLLFEQAVPLPAHPGLHVLAPADMVLHSMTHLFLNDDIGYALRDLSDLHLLLQHFGSSDGFWQQLVERAIRLDLTRPLYYGLRHTARLFATPIPASAVAAAQLNAPAPWTGRLMDAIWTRTLRSPHPSAAPALAATAEFALYLRGHWLRMPPWMLARHLATKALQRSSGKASRDAGPAV